MVVLNIVLILLISYLLGSIPTAIVAGKLLKGIDIREHGSGNAGGTNVFRVLGWKPGIAVMLIDMVKGFIATFYVAGIALSSHGIDVVYLQILAGLAAIFGHIWTIFANFRGGKGVGTAAGMLFALYPIAVLCCLGLFFIVVFTTRYVSLGSVLAASALPFVIYALQAFYGRPTSPVLLGFSIFVAILIVFTHRSNIKRLLNGTENRFGKPKQATSAE